MRGQIMDSGRHLPNKWSQQRRLGRDLGKEQMCMLRVRRRHLHTLALHKIRHSGICFSSNMQISSPVNLLIGDTLFLIYCVVLYVTYLPLK